MKKIILFLLLSVVIYGKLEVSATIFPLYDAARIIGGEKAEVSLLIRPGIEPHSFEPSPRDIARLNKADVFIYLDESMETWIEKFKKNIEVDTVSVGENIPFMVVVKDEDKHEHHFDPHVWLDPILYAQVVKNIAVEMIKRDPENSRYYRYNLQRYIKKLEDLDREIVDAVDRFKHRKIIYAGHFSFGYFVKRYDLDYITVYKNLSPNADISPRDMRKIIDVVRESGQGYIYQESLVNSKIAHLIARETDTKILKLHQLGGIGKEELSRGYTYIDIMKKNLENLKKGMDYGKDN